MMKFISKSIRFFMINKIEPLNYAARKHFLLISLRVLKIIINIYQIVIRK
jgi:hypothetical protein